MQRKEEQEEMFQPIKHLSGELLHSEVRLPFLSSRQSISGLEAQFSTFDSVMRLREIF